MTLEILPVAVGLWDPELWSPPSAGGIELCLWVPLPLPITSLDVPTTRLPEMGAEPGLFPLVQQCGHQG